MRSGIVWHPGAVSKGLEAEGEIALLLTDSEFIMFVFLGVHLLKPALFQDARILSGSVPSRHIPVASVVVLPWSSSFSAFHPCRRCAFEVVDVVSFPSGLIIGLFGVHPIPPPSTTFQTTGKLIRMVLTP